MFLAHLIIFFDTKLSEGWALPRRREDISSWEEAKQVARDLNPLQCSGWFTKKKYALSNGLTLPASGFVAVDSSFRRVCVKSPQFVAMECTLTLSNNGFGPINLNADALDEEGMLELLRNGSTGTALAKKQDPVRLSKIRLMGSCSASPQGCFSTIFHVGVLSMTDLPLPLRRCAQR